MQRIFQLIRSLFPGLIQTRMLRPSATSVIALIINEQDRRVIADVLGPESLYVRFVESWEEAYSASEHLTAPVVLIDRDWPGIEWKMAVERLATSPHQACVILVSGVADAYLWEELIRRGGYDLISKPLQPDNVLRVIRLALSYWNNTLKSSVVEGSVRK